MKFEIPTSLAEQERGLERAYTDMSEERALLKPNTVVGFSQQSLTVPETAKVTPVTPTSDLPVGLSLGGIVVSDIPQAKLSEVAPVSDIVHSNKAMTAHTPFVSQTINPFSHVVAERKMSL